MLKILLLLLYLCGCSVNKDSCKYAWVLMMSSSHQVVRLDKETMVSIRPEDLRGNHGNKVQVLGKKLKLLGLLKNEEDFYFIASNLENLGSFKVGDFKIGPYLGGGNNLFSDKTYKNSFELSPLRLFRILVLSTPQKRVLKIIPGNLMHEVQEKINNASDLNGEKIKDQPEGHIFAEFFEYAHGQDRLKLWKKITKRFDTVLEKYWQEADPKFKSIIKTKERGLILASIVEKESDSDRDQSLISGLFLNRLQSNMRLQSCPTTLYALYLLTGKKHSRLLLRHCKLKHPHNTYVNYNLPPTPICIVGLKTLKNTFNPIYTPYLFFFSKNKVNYFSKTFIEHICKRKQMGV